MKGLWSATLACALCGAVLASGPAAAQNPNYPNGFAGTNSPVIQGPGGIDGSVLRLLSSKSNEAASAMTATPVDVTSFTTRFLYQDLPGTEHSEWGHSVGLTFCIQNAGSNPPLRGGQYLGYGDIPNSVCVKLDVVDDAGEGWSSTGLYTGGAAPTVPALDTTTSGMWLNNTRLHEVQMTYSEGELVVIITSESGQLHTHTYAVDIPAIVGGSTAYVGFTASSEYSGGSAHILSWTFNPPPPPAIYRVAWWGADTNSGASWDQALATPAAALTRAAASGPGTQVWVAQGHYMASGCTVSSGVDFLGGFVGGETSAEQRDLANATWLEGGGSVYVSAGLPQRIDGFHISGAGGRGVIIQAGASPFVSGNRIQDNTGWGGLQCDHANPIIILNEFLRNRSQGAGGALYIGVGSWAHISGNWGIGNNSPTDGGGFLSSWNAKGLTIVGNAIQDNWAKGSAAVHCGLGDSDDPNDPDWFVFVDNYVTGNIDTEPGGAAVACWNCPRLNFQWNYIAGNRGGTYGGVLLHGWQGYGEPLVFSNNTVEYNEANLADTTSIGGAYVAAHGDGTVLFAYRNVVRGNVGYDAGGADINAMGGCQFAANRVLDNIGSRHGGMHNTLGAPWFGADACIFAGNVAGASGASALCDSTGWTEAFNCTFADNIGGRDTVWVANGRVTSSVLAFNNSTRAGLGTAGSLEIAANCYHALVGTPLYGAVGAVLTDLGGHQYGDPRFVDAASRNYSLQPGSSCIDTGQSIFYQCNWWGLGYAWLDRMAVGGARPDIGAYEYEVGPIMGIENQEAFSVTNTSIIIRWFTYRKSTSYAGCYNSTGYFDAAGDWTRKQEHLFIVPGLSPGMTYGFNSLSMDDYCYGYGPEQSATTEANATDLVSITRSGFTYNYATRRYVQTVTITNKGTSPRLYGTVSLVLDNLSTNATLYSPDGHTSAQLPAGKPYKNAGATPLAPGQSVRITLQFTKTGSAPITYTPRVLAGEVSR